MMSNCSHAPVGMRAVTLNGHRVKTGVTVIQAIQDAYQRLVMPTNLKPGSMSAQRSQYLYDKVREYVCDPRKRDDMCPKPPPASNLSHAAVNLRSQDQPGPSTAIGLVTSLMTVSVGSRMKIMAGNADQSLN